jgi:hypothetical protein
MLWRSIPCSDVQQATITDRNCHKDSRPKRSDQLCVRCRSLNIHRLFQMPKTDKTSIKSWEAYIYPLGVVQKSMSQARCPLCRLFAAILPQNLKATRKNYVLKAFSAIQHQFRYTYRTKQMLDSTILSIGPTNAVLWNPKFEHKLGTIHLARKHIDDKRSILGNRIHPSKIDYDIARSWIHYCKSYHKSYCNQQSSTFATSIPGFKLIDCETRQVSRHIERVDYVALSYVWGNACHASTRFVPKPASRTIEDAIIVTKALGFRYLWIDRYCISQLNDGESRDQITKMDQIYADAVLTIVAAAGEDSRHGLPGVSRTPRCLQPRAEVEGFQLVHSLRSPRDVVMSSKWASRGWTLQEARLSRRNLFFTDDQMLFECASMSCQETVLVPLDVAHQKHGHSMGRECDPMRIFPPNGPGRFPSDIITTIAEYTSRTLTWPSDNLNAVLGIFNSINSGQSNNQKTWGTESKNKIIKPVKVPVFHLWGIPVLAKTERHSADALSYLCSMLCWRCLSPSTRSPELPSWSWAGWELPSKVTFYQYFEGGKVVQLSKAISGIWLQTNSNEEILFQGLEDNSKYDTIMEEATQTLLLSGPLETVRFERVQGEQFLLKPIIDGHHESIKLRFWPNVRIDTESELTQFTSSSWRAIYLSGTLLSGGLSSLLVLKPKGRMWERVGVLDIVCPYKMYIFEYIKDNDLPWYTFKVR